MKGHHRIGYITDAYDLFAVAHLEQLRVARANCDFLIVGVLTDDLVLRATSRPPIVPFEERLAIARAMRTIDLAVGQVSDDLLDVWSQLRFDRLFVWQRSVIASSYAGLRPVGVDVLALNAASGGVSDSIQPVIAAALPNTARD